MSSRRSSNAQFSFDGGRKNHNHPKLRQTNNKPNHNKHDEPAANNQQPAANHSELESIASVRRNMANINLADFGPDAGGRIKGAVADKALVFGNIARTFAKKRDEDGHTHQWTVYVKPYRNEDMSAYVKKIHFKLHESYANANRILTKPPYEITETGWGEFEVTIKLYFHDPTERPVTLYHILKLFPSPGDSGVEARPELMDATGDEAAGGPPLEFVGKALVFESYDEMVFNEPTQLMQHCLNAVRPLTAGPYRHHTDFEAKIDTAAKQIDTASARVKAEIAEMKDKLQLGRDTLARFKLELAKVQKEAAAAAASNAGN